MQNHIILAQVVDFFIAGHIARNCWKPRKTSEAVGKRGGNSKLNKALVTVPEMSDSQLEQALANFSLLGSNRY